MYTSKTKKNKMWNLGASNLQQSLWRLVPKINDTSWMYVSPIGTATSPIYRKRICWKIIESCRDCCCVNLFSAPNLKYAENNIHAELQLRNWDCSGKYSRRRMLRRSKVCLAKIGAKEIETYRTTIFDSDIINHWTFLKPFIFRIT
jgi:hypothetical protein